MRTLLHTIQPTSVALSTKDKEDNDAHNGKATKVLRYIQGSDDEGG